MKKIGPEEGGVHPFHHLNGQSKNMSLVARYCTREAGQTATWRNEPVGWLFSRHQLNEAKKHVGKPTVTFGLVTQSRLRILVESIDRI